MRVRPACVAVGHAGEGWVCKPAQEEAATGRCPALRVMPGTAEREPPSGGASGALLMTAAGVMRQGAGACIVVA